MAKDMSQTYRNQLLAFGHEVRGGVKYEIVNLGTSSIKINPKTDLLRFYNKPEEGYRKGHPHPGQKKRVNIPFA